MHFLRSGFVILLLTTALTFATSMPAHAWSIWKTGVRVGNPGWEPMTVEKWDSGCPGQKASIGKVRWNGDYVFVKDNCRDGKSAVALVQYVTGPKQGNRFTCRNRRGAGTWTRCNFNWREFDFKMMQAGTYDGDTGRLSWYRTSTKYWANN